MTAWDFFYIIGSGVAFLMTFFILADLDRKLPEDKRYLGGVIICAVISAALSWAVPIWWIGLKIYQKYKEE